MNAKYISFYKVEYIKVKNRRALNVILIDKRVNRPSYLY